MTKPWYNVERVRQPGSVILTQWLAGRQARRAHAEAESAEDRAFSPMLSQLSAAGMAVTERTALCVSAVFACVALIAGAVSSLPFHIYRRTEDGRARANNDIWWLLNESPHPQWTAAAFWEYILQSRLFHGDAFARILRPSVLSNHIDGFEPVHPDRVKIVRAASGETSYLLRRDDNTELPVLAEDMLHIPGLGFNGLRSMSPLQHALRGAAGTALAADDYSGRFFSNGARPDFLLTTDATLKEEQLKLLRSAWDNVHAGSKLAHRPAILSGGLKVEQLTMTSEDAQLIATRQFQVEDIARVFGVPPFMIGHTEKTSSWGSGVEQMGIGFVKYTLSRHLVQIEQEINRKVWPRSLRLFGEFETAGLERGDYKSRNEGFRIALGRAGEPGWITINEVRRLINMPPVPNGDVLNTGGQANAKPNPA